MIQIAVAYGRSVRIFEPQPLAKRDSLHNLDYHWVETSNIKIDGQDNVLHLSWNLDGHRLLIGAGKRLMLYQHRMLHKLVTQRQGFI